MPKPTTSITTTQTTEVQLKPLLRRRLLQRLKAYAELHAQVKLLEVQKEDLKLEMDRLFEAAGESDTLKAGIKVDGFSVKKHSGEKTSRLDKVALCKNTGITMAQIAAATKESPKKEYVKVHVPGEKNDVD